MNKELNPEVQQKIFSLIKKNPGITAGRIEHMLSLEGSQVEQYLIYMELRGDIVASHGEDTTTYYLKSKKKGPRKDRRTQDTRVQIYNLIEKNPGIHLSHIADALQMSAQLADYHLIFMEKKNLIMAVKDSRSYYKRFYVKYSKVGVKEKKILTILRQRSLLRIIMLFINSTKPLRHKDILEKLDVQPAVLSYQLSKLVEEEVIDVAPYGEDKGYVLKDEKEIVHIIIKYRLEKILDGFKDVWKDINIQHMWDELKLKY